MNPFGLPHQPISEERKALENEFKLVLSKLFLNYAEEEGQRFSFEKLLCDVNGLANLQLVWMKTAAFHKYSTFATSQKSLLSEDDKIAIVAHESFKEVVRRSIGEEKLYGQG